MRKLSCIAMEYVEGSSLDRLLAPAGLPIQQVLDYALQIASALAAAHGAGIVHRDIKPANIMVTRSGQIKILDFGLARLMERTVPDGPAAADSGATAPGAVMGTVAYIAPEQAQGEAVDARADIFSFGAVLYEMVTGQRPLSAIRTSRLWPPFRPGLLKQTDKQKIASDKHC